MGLEVVQLPEPVDRVLADALRLGHQTATPVRHPFGFGFQRGLNDSITLGLIVLWLATSPRSGFPDTADPLGGDALAPQRRSVPVDLESGRDFQILLPLGGRQRDTASQRDLLRCGRSTQPGADLFLVFHRKGKGHG